MECWKALSEGNMCGAAKWVIVSKSDVSQDDSKLAVQTTAFPCASVPALASFLVCWNKPGVSSTCVDDCGCASMFLVHG